MKWFDYVLMAPFLRGFLFDSPAPGFIISIYFVVFVCLPAITPVFL